jgi:hypothetical protein
MFSSFSVFSGWCFPLSCPRQRVVWSDRGSYTSFNILLVIYTWLFFAWACACSGRVGGQGWNVLVKNPTRNVDLFAIKLTWFVSPCHFLSHQRRSLGFGRDAKMWLRDSLPIVICLMRWMLLGDENSNLVRSPVEVSCWLSSSRKSFEWRTV